MTSFLRKIFIYSKKRKGKEELHVAWCDYLSIIHKVPGYEINHYKITAGEAFPAGDTTAAGHAFLSARPRIGVRRRLPSFPWSAGFLSAEKHPNEAMPGRSVRLWTGGESGGNMQGCTAHTSGCQRTVSHHFHCRMDRHGVPVCIASTCPPGRPVRWWKMKAPSLYAGPDSRRTGRQGMGLWSCEKKADMETRLFLRNCELCGGRLRFRQKRAEKRAAEDVFLFSASHASFEFSP